MSADPLLAAAGEHLAAGDLARAERLCRGALALAGTDPAAWALLGQTLLAAARPGEALAAFDAALAADPRAAPLHDLRGDALAALGRSDDAMAAWRAALAIDPDCLPSLLSLADALAAGGHGEAAVPVYRQAIALAPGIAVAHNNLANTLIALGRPGQAEAPLREAVRLDPSDRSVLGNLFQLLHDLGRPGEVVALMPVSPFCFPVLIERYLFGLHCFSVVAAALRVAAGIDPGNPEIFHKLGHALAADGQPEAALAAFATAERLWRDRVRQSPDRVAAWHQLVFLLYECGRPEEGVACCDEALRLHPGNNTLRFVRGTCLHAAGRELEGWRDEIVRFAIPGAFRGQPHPAPLWDGSPAPGHTVLVTSDDGFGDFLQYCRFVKLAAQRARVVLQVQPKLLRLAATLAGPERVISMADWPAPADFRAPVTSLPEVLVDALDGVPAAIPYLHADPAAVAGWRARLGHLGGLRVGLAWAGDPRLNWDFLRSIAPDRLRALAGTPGVAFVSLQVGAAAPGWMHDPTAGLGDFADSAALVAALDLVIAVDSAVVHLAGALGRPVWLLNRFNAECRWRARGEDSPWYPTLRQFRQTRPGDWDEVLARVRTALPALAA